MKSSLIAKLEQMVERREEVARELGDPVVIGDADRFRRLSQEYAQLGPVVESYAAWREVGTSLEGLEQMRTDPDPELRGMAEDELPQLQARLEALQEEAEEREEEAEAEGGDEGTAAAAAAVQVPRRTVGATAQADACGVVLEWYLKECPRCKALLRVHLPHRRCLRGLDPRHRRSHSRAEAPALRRRRLVRLQLLALAHRDAVMR